MSGHCRRSPFMATADTTPCECGTYCGVSEFWKLIGLPMPLQSDCQEMAVACYECYRDYDRAVTNRVEELRRTTGVALSTDKILGDAIADRNRYIQLTIMYSNLAMMQAMAHALRE